jgi:hypothetical protein
MRLHKHGDELLNLIYRNKSERFNPMLFVIRNVAVGYGHERILPHDPREMGKKISEQGFEHISMYKKVTRK